jgi:outer membrane receptor protein involved in Fe transport
MFLTIAVRSDQNSAFGTNFQRVFYRRRASRGFCQDESFFPRVSGLNSFRLRGAFGASGVQPGATSALVTYSAPTVSVNAIDTPGLTASALGNPNLKPERASEFEGGFDTRLMNNRVNFEFTYYNKKTKDALFSEVIAPSAGASAGSVLATWRRSRTRVSRRRSRRRSSTGKCSATTSRSTVRTTRTRSHRSA